MVKPILQWEVAVADQEFPTDQLPDLPPIDLEQGPNNNNNLQLNPPNQPLDLPTGEENQPNQQDFPADQQNQTEEPNEVPNQQPNQPNQPPNPPP